MSAPVVTAPTPVPNGHIDAATLRNATLDIPAWPADNVQGPSGALRFRDGEVVLDEQQVPSGQPPHAAVILILSVTYGDVDGDGSDETIAVVGCLIEGGAKQVIAFDRDASGKIVTLGRITGTTGTVRDIRDDSPRVARDGLVTVRVGDYQRCCADRTPQIWQKRGYRWRNGAFEQVSGPTRMPAGTHVTETRLTTSGVKLTTGDDGYRYGTLSVQVEHLWGAHPEKLALSFGLPAGVERSGSGWPAVTKAGDGFTVTVDGPPAGATATYRFAFRQRNVTTPGELTVDESASPLISEAIPWNNTVTAKF
ncbi:hypothetical protein [Actinoplanes sp. NPDC051851]|uniref:hypothetical protein n=1 Tax=Actinoplanes sp. NPDC051851 TaxID=3154753 RepID=UPI00342F96BA